MEPAFLEQPVTSIPDEIPEGWVPCTRVLDIPNYEKAHLYVPPHVDAVLAMMGYGIAIPTRSSNHSSLTWCDVYAAAEDEDGYESVQLESLTLRNTPEGRRVSVERMIRWVEAGMPEWDIDEGYNPEDLRGFNHDGNPP